MEVRVGLQRKLSTEELMLLNCGIGEDFWESFGLQEIQPVHPKWNQSNTLATWHKGLTHWKRPWCCERLRAGGEGDDRGWDGWMAYWLNGHGFGWTPGVGDGQGGLACCSSWGHKESDMTEWLNCVTVINSQTPIPNIITLGTGLQYLIGKLRSHLPLNN